MIDEKLMKVLECCANDDCGNCPTQVKQCRQHAMLNALDLIKRRDEEIEEQDQAIINALHYMKDMKVVRAEAIKEFAERLKKSAFDCDVSFGFGRECYTEAVTVIEIDRIAEEMTEETKHD